MAEKLLTVREVAHSLHLTEQEVINLTEKGDIPAYRIGGVYLRYKKEQIAELKKKHLLENKHKIFGKLTFSDKIKDFIYFHDFYIISIIIITIMLFFILRA